MKKYLINGEKNKYKANLGCYTNLSLGRLSPEELKQYYKAEGYSIIAFSDFNALQSHTKLNDEEFLTITAYKTAIKNYHFTLYSKTENNPPIVSIPCDENLKQQVNTFISNADKSGFMVCIDHPTKSMQCFHDYDGITGYFALEITDFSSMTDGYIEDNNHIYDRILRNSIDHVYPLACDGNRNKYPFDSPRNDSFGAFTVICAENLNYCEIIKALEGGSFYASTGPTFEEVYMENNKVYIKCSPVRSIRLLNEGRDAPVAIAPDGELINQAEFEIDPDFSGRFVRVDIRDEHGNFANTVPFYLNCLKGE